MSTASPSERANGVTTPLRHATIALAELGPSISVSPGPATGRPTKWRWLLRGYPPAVANSAMMLSPNEVGRALDTFAPDAVLAYLGPTSASIPDSWRPRTLLIVQDSMTRVTAANPRFDASGPVRRVTQTMNVRMLEAYERRTYADFGLLQVTTDSEAAFLRQIGVGAPILVNSNGVNPRHRPRREFDSRPFDFLAAGDFSAARARGVASRSLEVAATLARERPVRHLIAGWSSGSVAHVAATGLETVAAGHLDGEEAFRSAIANCKLMVCLDSTSTGIKNSVLEALVEGVVVIASSAVASALPDGTVLIATGHQAAVHRARDLLDDPAAWEKQSKRASAAVEADRKWSTYRERMKDALQGLSSDHVTSAPGSA